MNAKAVGTPTRDIRFYAVSELPPFLMHGKTFCTSFI